MENFSIHNLICLLFRKVAPKSSYDFYPILFGEIKKIKEMQEENIYENPRDYSVEVKDNIYETVCADGVNYYERVDHINPNVDYVTQAAKKRRKFWLILFGCLVLLISVLSTVLMLKLQKSDNKNDLVDYDLVETVNFTTTMMAAPANFLNFTAVRSTTASATNEMFCESTERVLCMDLTLAPYCNLTMFDENGNLVLYCNAFLPEISTTESTTITTTTAQSTKILAYEILIGTMFYCFPIFIRLLFFVIELSFFSKHRFFIVFFC